jgi:hypothetical protein
MPDLIPPLPSTARHRRNWHSPRVKVPPTGEVDVAQVHIRLLVVQGLRDLHIHVGAVPLPLGRRRLLLHGRGRRSAIRRFLERLVPCHGGLGRWRCLLWLLSASLQIDDMRAHGSLMAAHRVGSGGDQRDDTIDGGTEAEVTRR